MLLKLIAVSVLLSVRSVEADDRSHVEAEVFLRDLFKAIDRRSAPEIADFIADDFEFIKCQDIDNKQQFVSLFANAPSTRTDLFTDQPLFQFDYWPQTVYTDSNQNVIKGVFKIQGIWFRKLEIQAMLMRNNGRWQWKKASYNWNECV